MSALLLPALAAGSSGQGALYADDVFSTYLRAGTGADTTVTTGIDMTKGYMLWSKGRSGATVHAVYDSARGVTLDLVTNSDAAQTTQAAGLKAVSSTGHTIGSLAKMNTSGETYVDWVFRKAPKFFDVVTYTGNGVAGRQIAHGLGMQAGFVTVKSTSTTGDWNSYHRSATGDLKLNLTAAQTASRAIITAADASTFTVSGAANTNGVSYVAYLWAHDPSAEGIIQCGSFTTDGSGNATVNLGWEPQYLLMKRTDSAGDWSVQDAMRGMTGSNQLTANTAQAEGNGSPYGIGASPLQATGFKVGSSANMSVVYLAIRRPNKPPKTGAEVYNAIARTGTGAAATVTGVGFAPDAALIAKRTNAAGGAVSSWHRLIGAKRYLLTHASNSEAGNDGLLSFDQDGYSLTAIASSLTNRSDETYIDWVFRRSPCVFDVVCDTGTGAAHVIAHNLTKTPELIIRKSRSAATQWEVWHSALAATEKLVLNSNAAKATDAAAWNSTLPTTTQFTVGTGANVNANAATFVTYLFATLAGISKVGSYTGNGSSQTIDCGFSTGARFFLVKATSATGSWWVYDSARGIVSAADPALQLNSNAAEITSADAVDPTGVGIIVNQEATCSINATGVSYIFLAIA